MIWYSRSRKLHSGRLNAVQLLLFVYILTLLWYDNSIKKKKTQKRELYKIRTKLRHRNMLHGVPFSLNDSLLNDMPIFNSTSIEFLLTCFSNDGGGGQSRRILLWGAGKVLCDSQEHIQKERDMHL